MSGQEIRELCLKKLVTFIPHHPCACCGYFTGWYLFGRWPLYDVAYSDSCGCGFGGGVVEDTWDNIAKWVCDNNGELREDYKWLID